MLRTLLALTSLLLYWWLCLLRAACTLVVTASTTTTTSSLTIFIYNLGWIVTVDGAIRINIWLPCLSTYAVTLAQWQTVYFTLTESFI